MSLSEDEVQKLVDEMVERVIEEKRRHAFEHGKRVEYLTCPLCGRNKPLHTWKGKTSFVIKPDYAIIQVRYGGGKDESGKGIGFWLKLEESTNLSKLSANYPEVFENLKDSIIELYESFLGLP